MSKIIASGAIRGAHKHVEQADKDLTRALIVLLFAFCYVMTYIGVLPKLGYVIGFCCANSSAYKGGWSRMSEADKDAFVRQCLK